MSKKQNWYLRGWTYSEQISPSGFLKKALIYTGEYYLVRLHKKSFYRVKFWSALETSAIYVLYIWISLLSPQGSRVVYVGAAAILAIIPLMFQGMGVFCLLRSPQCMSYRDYCAGWRRTMTASVLTAILFSESFLGQSIFLILYIRKGLPDLFREWIWFGGSLFSAAFAYILFFMLKRVQVDILSNENGQAVISNWGDGSSAEKWKV